MRGDPVSTVDRAGLVWRKSSRSGGGNNDNCVEVAFFAPEVVVRDSKNPRAGVVAFSASAWQRFLRR
ncbi:MULTISPECIES: DUF397 domain-containing protein [Saccharothrix]|uniref:DUF397 domain-containing protein n=1 Tax=Saccharothrix TaxID=2071 RepID=UPI00093B826D|nr:DUF397 domain-containing protein [Saccharothrix sp. CB00851]